MEEKKKFVSGVEQAQVSRALLAWLNQYPCKPVRRIEFEFLPNDKAGMSLTTVQSPYKIEEYITGEYTAQYQFGILYRSQPETSGDRLTAEETLNGIGMWAEERREMPALGSGKTAVQIERDATATLIARYEDKSEDYKILMSMTYGVN